MKTIEELEALLETVTRERDVACDDLAFILAEYANERNEELTEDALCLKIAGLTHQRDEARAEVERLTDERDELLVRVADQGAELRATREVHNEARAEVERLSDASTHWQVMLKRETEEVERLERELQIERMGIRPIDEVRCAAYRRGAEAMREACAQVDPYELHRSNASFARSVDSPASVVRIMQEAIRALPIPEEP